MLPEGAQPGTMDTGSHCAPTRPTSKVLRSGPSPPEAQAGMKLRRTFLTGLSRLGSTSTIDCQTPSAGRPASTGKTRLGETMAGMTWSAPWPGDPCRWRQPKPRGRMLSRAARRSGTLPAPLSIKATPQVECGANTETNPSPRDMQNVITSGVRSSTAGWRPVRTSRT